MKARQFSLGYLLLEVTLFALGFSSLSVFLRAWHFDTFDPGSLCCAAMFLCPAIGGLLKQMARGLQAGIIFTFVIWCAAPVFYDALKFSP